MNRYLKIGLMVIATLVLAEGVWLWFFCRFYVGPNRMAIVTAKTGAPLESGQILAQKGQKGIWEKPLGEGRHFLNPVLYDWEIVPVTLVKPGKAAVVTSKIGKPLPEGEFIAQRGEKGIWHGVLGPGKYRLNPYGYSVSIVDAISIPIGYVGVVTSLSGEQAEAGQFAEKNQKGVRRDVLQPGLYYINPKEYKVDVLEIGINQVSLLGQSGSKVVTKARQLGQNEALNTLQSAVLQKQEAKRKDYLSRKISSLAQSYRKGVEADFEPGKPVREQAPAPLEEGEINLTELVSFPSRDGFLISLDMTVEFELAPDRIASIFRRYGDLPAVVDKIIMPQITSISRNKGSEYRAKDFIVGEGREKFQNDLTSALEQTLGGKGITVYNALIRHVEVPDQIREPIQQASIAVEQDLTNKERQNTARKLAELNTELSLIKQRGEQVQQETEKIKAEIKADLGKQVAEIKAETLMKTAEIKKATAEIQANRTRVLGEAEAKALQMVDGEKAKGLAMKTSVFKDPVAYAQYRFADRLNPQVSFNIIHAGEGTLWTDLKNTGFAELGGASSLKKNSASGFIPPQGLEKQ